jgi:hypothetical protein
LKIFENNRSAQMCSQIQFFNCGRFGSSFPNGAPGFSQVRNQKEKLFFYHAPYVGFHVQVKEIMWDYVEPGAKQHENELEQVCVLGVMVMPARTGEVCEAEV